MTQLGSWPVDRTAIIGCGGSGKSRVARALGDTLGLTRSASRPCTWTVCTWEMTIAHNRWNNDDRDIRLHGTGPQQFDRF